jgi:osmoprotectant transport system substrate-binding protein
MARAAKLLLALLLATCAACRPEGTQPIAIGSKNFTEQIILGELLAQHIEASAGLPVERRFDLAGTLICHQALRSGEIDLYVEYTGTALTVILEEEPSQDSEEVHRRVAGAYRQRFDLEWAPPLGFNNTFALVIRGEDARRLNLEALSDIAPYTPNWRAGFGYEFMERPDGFQGLAATYGLRFGSPPRTMELGLLYRALTEKQVDIVAGSATDGSIAALDFVMLEDDRRYFPPYYAAPVVRREALERHPGLGAALGALAGKISEAEMRQLNYAVEGEGRGVKQVVRDFLQAKGL